MMGKVVEVSIGLLSTQSGMVDSLEGILLVSGNVNQADVSITEMV
jgi:hypothetical protein